MRLSVTRSGAMPSRILNAKPSALAACRVVFLARPDDLATSAVISRSRGTERLCSPPPPPPSLPLARYILRPPSRGRRADGTRGVSGFGAAREGFPGSCPLPL